MVSHVTCESCFPSSLKEEKCNIICLLLASSISSSLGNLFKSENLNNNSRWFCNLWSNLQDNVRDWVSIPIILLARYINFEQNLIKDNRKANCPSKYMSLLVFGDDDVTIWRMFKLRVTINNYGTINAGYCQLLFRGTEKNFLLKRNDTSVTKTSLSTWKCDLYLFHCNPWNILVFLKGGFTLWSCLWVWLPPLHPPLHPHNPSNGGRLGLLTLTHSYWQTCCNLVIMRSLEKGAGWLNRPLLTDNHTYKPSHPSVL